VIRLTFPPGSEPISVIVSGLRTVRQDLSVVLNCGSPESRCCRDVGGIPEVCLGDGTRLKIWKTSSFPPPLRLKLLSHLTCPDIFASPHTHW
jgi:hypothetical protein